MVPITATIAFLLHFAETLFVYWRYKAVPVTNETVKNAVIFGAGLVIRGALFGARLFVFYWFASLFSTNLPTNELTGIGMYVAIDFIYYWKHRFMHRFAVTWALHQTHHSITDLNFFSTLRLNWIESIIQYLFYLPLALTGFDAFALLMLIELNSGWQYIVHSKINYSIPVLEKIINTPNFHRVHHAADMKYAHSNYTSTLVLWDRLFGTYSPPQRECLVGIEADDSENRGVLDLQFGGLIRLLRRG